MCKVRFLAKIVLTAGISFAMTLTLFACSSNGGGGEPTFYYSMYGVKSCSAYEALITAPNFVEADKFKSVEEAWSKIKQLDGSFIESGTGWLEMYLREELVKHDMTPKEVDGFINRLKVRGNSMIDFVSNDIRYCYIIWYLERE